MKTSITISHRPSIKITAIQRGKTTSVHTGRKTVTVVSASRQGPPGVSAADISAIPCLAGENISGHRVVSIFNNVATYADKDSAYFGQLGLTKGASNTGTGVEAYTMGIITEPTWSWVVGPIYLGSNGALTQIRPTFGTLVIVGRAISATSISVQFQQLYRMN